MTRAYSLAVVVTLSVLVYFNVGKWCALEVTPNPRVLALRTAAKENRVIVSPSVAKADFWNLGKDLSEAVEGGAEWLHFAVQDGRMAPKISIGSPVIKAARSKLPNTIFDVKLGVINPEDRIAEFANAGADIISIHPEATLQVPAVLHAISEAACAPGVILNPGTSISVVEPVLDQVDVIVVMLVNPGWGGPQYLKSGLDKITRLRQMCNDLDLNPWIEVDGGVSSKNAADLIAAGANALVLGSSVFSASDKRKAINDVLVLFDDGFDF